MKTKKIISLILLFAFALFCESVYAKENAPTVRTSVDRKTILIGDRIKYSISASCGKSMDISFPGFQDDKIGDFEVKESGRVTKKGFFDTRTITNWYSITAYSVGKHSIPEAEIRYRKKGSSEEWKSVKVKAVNIIVQSVLPGGSTPADIKDIKGPIGFFEINWWIVGTILVVISAALLYLIRRRRFVPVKLPHETAMEELESAHANFLRGGSAEDYYVSVSDCVRRYIERAFRLKAPEMTTEEFLNSLKDTSRLSLEQKGLLGEFLNACDLVKFAKYAPSRPEADTVFETAKKFIEETKG